MALIRRGLEATRAAGDPGDSLRGRLEALACLQLGNVAWQEGSLQLAESYYKEARRHFSQQSMPREEALAVGSLALIHHGRRDF